jgi:hypothetical protein
MLDGFSILSPAGYVMDVSVVSPVNGTGTFGPQFVSQILPGGGIHTRGFGEIPVTGISGRQGTIRANFITGAAGTNQALAFIAVSTTVLLGIALDTLNRPYVILKNLSGTTIGQSNVVGGPVAAGVPLLVQFAWNSQGIVYAGLHAGVEMEGEVADWITSPNASWAFFVPTKLYVGTTLGGLGLGSFTGVIGNIQVSDQVIFSPLTSDVIEATTGITASMAGASTMTATARVVYKGAATLAGSAAVAATARVVYDGSSTMAGSSSVAADGELGM